MTATKSMAAAAALIALAIGAAASALAEERLANPFADAPLGQSALFDTDAGVRLYVLEERRADGYVEAVYDGCPSSGDRADLGDPRVRHVYNVEGELIRSEWASGERTVYAPHGCSITLGLCEGSVRYRGWLPDPEAVERYAFANDAIRDGDRVSFTYTERTVALGEEVARLEGWYTLDAEGYYTDGASREQRAGEPMRERWFRRIAGPGGFTSVCAGVA